MGISPSFRTVVCNQTKLGNEPTKSQPSICSLLKGSWFHGLLSSSQNKKKGGCQESGYTYPKHKELSPSQKGTGLFLLALPKPDELTSIWPGSEHYIGSKRVLSGYSQLRNKLPRKGTGKALQPGVRYLSKISYLFQFQCISVLLSRSAVPSRSPHTTIMELGILFSFFL